MSVILGLGAIAGSFGVSAINNFGLGHIGRGGLGVLALTDLITRGQDRIQNKHQSDSLSGVVTHSSIDAVRFVGDAYILFESAHYFLDIGPDVNGNKTLNFAKNLFKEDFKKEYYFRDVMVNELQDLDDYWKANLGMFWPQRNTYAIISEDKLRKNYPEFKKFTDDEVRDLLHYTKLHELTHAKQYRATFNTLGEFGLINRTRDTKVASGYAFCEFFTELRCGAINSQFSKIKKLSQNIMCAHATIWFTIFLPATTLLLYDALKWVQGKIAKPTSRH